MKNLILDGNSLTIEDVYRASIDEAHISFSPSAKRRIRDSRHIIDEWLKRDEPIYGVTTGFGEFSNVRISHENIEKLQENLIMSHSAGAGDPLPTEVVRAMMILRMNALVKGYSGIRLETVDFLRRVFNGGVVPQIPSRGSVGSSGDLVQLAHLVLALMGKGKVWYRGKLMDSSRALPALRMKPLKLSAKEGLALINGTQMMTSFATLAVRRARALCKLADISATMSLEALRGSDTAFNERIHLLRPHKGQIECATNLRKLMKGSVIRESHRYDDHKVQDPYSLRCIPQVHGASRDAIRYAYDVVTTEINSATDNPLIFADKKLHLEGGNFHGQPVAFALDFLAIALSELANIAERRIERMVNGSLSGLPRFLCRDGGLNSGMMIAQYTAASLVSENKVLSHPASVDSIPTSANQEDHNSMGSIAALKAWQVLKNVQTVIAIEFLVAAQGLDFACIHPVSKQKMRAGLGVQTAHDFIRKQIKHLDRDRVLHTDIKKALDIVNDEQFLKAIEVKVGGLI